VVTKLTELAEVFPTRGFDKYYRIIRREGLIWARSRVLRIYREMKLVRRRRHKKRVPARVKEPLQVQLESNYSYSMDFMSDSLVSGRKIRILKIMDDGTRESLAVWCDYSIPGEKVVEVLEMVIAERGIPKQIRVDNGPEFTSKSFVGWCHQHGIGIKYIQPGRPMQNAYIERLNRTFREDILDAYLLENLEETRMLSDEWQYKYNYLLPHESLNDQTPAMARKSLPAAPSFRQVIEQEQQKENQQRNIQSLILTKAKCLH
jgi:putative transposase